MILKKILKNIILISIFSLSACSSAPKRIMLVTQNRDLSYSQLEGANNSIAEGNFPRAFNQLSSAYSLALSVDNAALLCKISLSGIVFKISSPPLFEIVPATENESGAVSKSFLTASKEEILESAKKFASRAGFENSGEKKDETKLLSDLCVIYEVRVLLENEKSENDGKISGENAKNYVSMLENIKSSVSKEPYYSSYLERTKGDVFMATEDFGNAKKSYEAAAAIHTKNRYLSEIALDWYCVARAASQNGQKNDAIVAIRNALKYDKDAENTNGIASDYLAYSKILLKGTPTDEEKKLSEELEKWAREIQNSRKNISEK